MFNQMLYCIPADQHNESEIKTILSSHPEVKFVSLVGLDIGGSDTDAKIPVALFLEDLDKFLKQGVQTDGSSVVLPGIAALNNARVDIIPDLSVNWYVDYNFSHLSEDTKLPVGSLRIPSFLVHNDIYEVGSRVVLRDAIAEFKQSIMDLLAANPYIFEYLPIDDPEEIQEIQMTAATELEFWVKTPDDKADREQLSTSQILKEQYWKRTIGPVRTALEKTILMLDRYGFGVEMGHKEVGGVKAKLGNTGDFDHVMEQLEIDWKYSDAMQAADNESIIKYIVRDVFRANGLDVSFMAKPIEGIAGSGEHTHMGVTAKLKNGKVINLFAPLDMKKDFMNPIGYGALMGILKNYEVINPFVSSSIDALNRLKPGFEAPVCIVTSLGHEAESPSRNRTILVGLVRDVNNPMATRFELRSPNPKSNTYLVLASAYLAMIDGIQAVLEAKKSPADLEEAISKGHGQEAFYLEKDRIYRSEHDVFEEYTQEERDKYFGHAPATVWDNVTAFDLHPEKRSILQRNDVFDDLSIESYKAAMINQWAAELQGRIIPNSMNFVRECKKIHADYDCTDYDLLNWTKIHDLRIYLGQDRIQKKSLLTRIKIALENKDYALASSLQIEMQQKIQELTNLYLEYRSNIL